MSINQNDRTNECIVAAVQAGDNEAENMLELWQQNKGFIAMMARRYSAGAEMEDLEQEGYIALCEAVQHYDPARGMSFISYAAFWIKRRMRICADNSRTVRLSFNAGDEVRQYQKIMREYRQEYGCDPSDWELCGFLYVSREKLNQIRKAAQMGNIRSLSEPIPGMDEDISLGDTVASGEVMEEDTIREIDKERMKRELWLAVDQLPGDQPAVLRMVYGDGMTRIKAGEVLGYGNGKVGIEERRALNALQKPHRCKKFRAYFEEYLSAAPVHHVGVKRYLETWESEVEREALRWAEKELGYS
ncbi:sigma-70 family RNA polymerase sigma factor [Mediterraneibacter glycyrrhizinilyticus]|uniref:sigma-70 family RNA polymerase sigma factor n=1 Tax=Mediterraneibacter glycyrrhizinilyticus TaxID=342942 RepID=UPI0025AA9C27|nr:sigma-70 family RNA polymerase sigma factor [Mediterraneibacter glycyrrhizinilyticus]MDN0044181.1 sigma-70 family RNA polymerase sigma factor [Mediterraneibacter glycyrrhizinilyticus]